MSRVYAGASRLPPFQRLVALFPTSKVSGGRIGIGLVFIDTRLAELVGCRFRVDGLNVGRSGGLEKGWM